MNKDSTLWTAYIDEASQEDYVSYISGLGLHLRIEVMARLITTHSTWKGCSRANALDGMAGSVTFSMRTHPNFEPRVVLSTQSSYRDKRKLCT